ncbi:hypothetical protein [Krasilnikovia sp. MM14-A1004]|uniref:hypothetical protein n=1 Tax=Krasilnikovia sp. MM14-A1004 TaxID=3373541 RepID=UPI00399C4FAC
MTTYLGRPVTQRAAGQHPIVTRDHLVVGTVAQLVNLITRHRAAGTLVAITTPRPLSADRFQVVMRLREPIRPGRRVTSVGDYARTRAAQRSRRRTRVAAFTGTIAGLLAVGAFLLGQLAEIATAHAAPILGVLGLAALAAGLTRRPRRHCRGC